MVLKRNISCARGIVFMSRKDFTKLEKKKQRKRGEAEARLRGRETNGKLASGRVLQAGLKPWHALGISKGIL